MLMSSHMQDQAAGTMTPAEIQQCTRGLMCWWLRWRSQLISQRIGKKKTQLWRKGGNRGQGGEVMRGGQHAVEWLSDFCHFFFLHFSLVTCAIQQPQPTFLPTVLKAVMLDFLIIARWCGWTLMLKGFMFRGWKGSLYHLFNRSNM